MKNKIYLLPLAIIITTFIAMSLAIYYGNIPKPIKIPQYLGMYYSTTNDSIILLDLNNTAIIAIDENVNTYTYEIIWGNNESESNIKKDFILHHWEVDNNTKEIEKQVITGYRYIQFVQSKDDLSIFNYGRISVPKFDSIVYHGIKYKKKL